MLVLGKIAGGGEVAMGMAVRRLMGEFVPVALESNDGIFSDPRFIRLARSSSQVATQITAARPPNVPPITARTGTFLLCCGWV